MRNARSFGIFLCVFAGFALGWAWAADAADKAPSKAEWEALGDLPDWSGTWQPNVADWQKKVKTEPVPWLPAAAAQIKKLQQEEDAGKPRGVHNTCLPLGMPSFMMLYYNEVEFLFTPGRITVLGETDGNNLRRIYTDGRKHTADRELTRHGDSVGHWEDKTLVVDTVGVVPETELSLSESVGIANGGDMHIVERIHLVAPDIMNDDIAVTAPHVLAAPWKTTRRLDRHRGQKFEIVEGQCQQDALDKVDAKGNAIFDAPKR